MEESFIPQICAQEGLSGLEIQSLSGGQINHVFQVGDSFILRVGKSPQANTRLAEEAALLQRIGHAAPVPEILAVGEHEGCLYQVQRRIPGEKLHRLWPRLSTVEKEQIMAQLGPQLDALHDIHFSTYGWFHEKGVEYEHWSDYFEGNFRGALEGLNGLTNGIPAHILRCAEGYYEDHKALFAQGTPDNEAALVHADLWPGNILVNNGVVTGLLDFEFAIRAPRDYELVLMEDFCLYPQDFFEAGGEVTCAADFADYLPTLRKYCPSLFAIPHLRERLNLYHLAFNLSLYAGFRRWNADESGAYLLAKLARITNSLFGHGIRMF